MSKKIMSQVSILALAVLSIQTQANAQSTDQTSENQNAWEENVIVVTATKRAEAITDVPVAITAFSGDNLEELGVREPVELADFTAGLSAVNNSVGAPAYTLRGVGLEDFIGNNTSGTAVYIDEVYPVSATQQGFGIFDLQRVEVLKGPQGTLYGRNATGGAINFVPNRPTSDLEASVSARLDSLAEAELTGIISGPLAESISGRVSVNYKKGLDRWQDGRFGGAGAGKADRLSGRLQFAFESGDSFEALITVFGELDNGINTTWQSDDQLGYEATTGIRVGSTERSEDASLGEFFTNIDGVNSPQNDTSAWGSTLRLKTDFDGGSIASITNYQTMDRDSYDNNDGSPEELADFHFLTDVEQFSQELRLDAEIGNVGSVIVGAFYGWDSIDVNDVAALTGFLDVFGLPSPTPGGEATVSVDSTQKTDSLGLYLHSEWQVTDQLNVTLAGRYTYENRQFNGAVFDDQGFFFGAPGPIFSVFGQPAFMDLEESEEDFSYRVGLDFKPNDDTLLYASVSTGFKSGVFYSGAVFDPRGWGYIEPEELTAFEAGAKFTTFDGRAQINIAGFYYDYKNKQTLVFIDDPFGAIATLGNVPESTVFGGELEVSVNPIQGLEVFGGISYINSEIDVAPATVRGAPLLSSIQVGDTLTQSPEFSANLRAVYTTELTNNVDGAVQLSYSYSDQRSLFLSDPLSRSDAYNSVGLRFTVKGKDERWSFSIYGQNITNEKSVTLAFGNIIGNRTFALQRPRVVGAEAKFSF